MLRKEGGVWKQNPQMLMMPTKGSFFSLKEEKRLSKYLKEHDLEEDTRPYISRKPKDKGKRKSKTVKGGDEQC